MSLLNKLLHFVILTSNKYKIDESHGLKHSMDVLQFAYKIFNAEKINFPEIVNHERIIFTSAIVHDMCDKKYMTESEGISNIEEFLKTKIEQNEIDIIKQKLGKEYIACHIRRTDALTHKWYSKELKNDDQYINFIDQYPKELKIYIAADCRDTQKKFIDMYGDRMIYKKIEDNDNLRQTSIQDAVKDIYVCAGATYFIRSVGSFSDTIMNLRKE